MPPKKKKGGGKKDGGGGEEGGALEGLNSTGAKMREFQIESLKMQLAERSEITSAAQGELRELRKEVESLKQELKDEKETHMATKKDMTSTYERMQENLRDRILSLSNAVQDLNDKLEGAEIGLERMEREKDREIAQKDVIISTMKGKMEDMALEFGSMLKETLEKMRERIELSNNNSFDPDSGVPIQKTMEQFQWNQGGAEAK
jgi:chromosome segregation ATPase